MKPLQNATIQYVIQRKSPLTGSSVTSKLRYVMTDVANLLENYPGDEVSVVTQLHCGACKGSGRQFYGKRIRKQRECPACRGKGWWELAQEIIRKED